MREKAPFRHQIGKEIQLTPKPRGSERSFVCDSCDKSKPYYSRFLTSGTCKKCASKKILTTRSRYYEFFRRSSELEYSLMCVAKSYMRIVSKIPA